LLEPRVRHLEPRERELVIGGVLGLVRMETWDFVTRQVGLSDDEAGRAAGWALQMLLEGLERSQKQGRRRLLDDAVVERGRNWSLHAESRVEKKTPRRTQRPKRGREK
jgi:hypothetical protein